ncbi:lipid-A-disaccharide synthase N-terminal domain-containing protein [Pseudochryseolinea flava]|uniref:Lauroyl acyltransferase n=1 Tax=Pseudochryseolinea flava TaxID=2059302 RepID=A0A364Y9G9_9BACT|nr:lipid-A-disaccharide synthase N-terminal domain-containing protein [Pseudochryseolinea flava]RAW03105.1 lauroyl acyltransferase [Pseudochryseolinea flava]
MKEIHWYYALGYLAQSMFGARQLVQLFQSEKQRKVVSPTLFWQLSLVGSLLTLIYGILLNSLVVVLGQILSYFIYVRNLQLKLYWQTLPRPVRVFLLLLPFMIVAWSIWQNKDTTHSLLTTTDFTDAIILIGTAGQLMLNLRFIYQWYYSEKQKVSTLPLGFWIISATASLLNIPFALYVTETKVVDLVLLTSSSLGLMVYLRNIYLHFKSRSNSKS